MSSELDRITAIEDIKELGEKVGAIGPEEENIINKLQPEARLTKFGIKEVLFKEAHVQFIKVRANAGVHVHSLDLKIMLGVEGELFVGEDELGELDKELSEEWRDVA